MRYPFHDRLEKGPILADGAMGSMLYAEGVDYHRCFDELNLTDPALVQSIHRRYLTAGAEIIETNTYSANRFKLARHGLEAKVREINRQGVRVAREAREMVGEPIFVAGGIGPTGLTFRPGLKTKQSEIELAYKEQAEGLIEGGVDLFILETFTTLEELSTAVHAVRSICDLPIIAEVTFNEDGYTLGGDDPAKVVEYLEDLQVDVLGINCTIGPQGSLAIIERMAGCTHTPLAVMPAAGQPSLIDGRFLYLSSPAYFGEYARRFVEAGAKIIGGCCGTTPQHIKAMKESIAYLQPAQTRSVIVSQQLEPLQEEATAAKEAPTPLAQKLANGKFVVSVELDPPRGINPAKVIAGAAMLRDLGVDSINIGDSPMARVRMSCIALARLIQEQSGVETIIHFTTRDRNLMAIQSELIGAHALGIRNVIALTGDPPRLGDYPNATGIWDVDSIGLISILKRLNEGRDYAGNSLARPTSFFIACALTPQAPDRVKERERLRRKLDAGADIVMTQPLYTKEEVEECLDYFGPIPVPILLGVLPLQSYRHAEFMHNEVPGIFVSQELRDRMQRAGEKGIEEGIEMSCELLTDTKDMVSGTYLMPSFGRYEVVGEIVKAVFNGQIG
ncbi:MAG: bifunctional homocysteine S-methyltransferase/methylenetetrahydrofolate reductase [Dehalococcoidia bacterium]|nr:bifunctional homocysteine S-methyltransferase/methylenetetrahydrofolate reductase [Dehalococcoidia bacterium]